MNPPIEETQEQFVAWGDKMIAATEFWIEADSFAGHALWREWHERLEWRQEGRGQMLNIGMFYNRPVSLNLWWHYLDGHLVCMYDCCSQVADYAMVEKWVCEKIGERRTLEGRWPHCDAMNFHNCLLGLNIKPRG